MKLGGYVILPRMLDKGRGELAGQAGDYHFACPLDQHFLSFTQLAAEDILNLLKQEKSDSEILAWVREHAKQNQWGVFYWSEFHIRRGPTDNESRQYFIETLQKTAPDRDDIATGPPTGTGTDNSLLSSIAAAGPRRFVNDDLAKAWALRA